jgi:hypothetical protein
VWGGDLPHETSWFWPRSETSWRFFSFVVIGLMFVVPTVAMLFRAIKDSREALAFVAAIVLLGGWSDTFWLVAPSLRLDGFALRWQDVATLVAQGGLWLAVLAAIERRRARRPFAVEVPADG